MSGYTQEQDQKQILGHPVGLFVLFFTEMWERFSYYGMRSILILFLVTNTGEGGWGWSREEAAGLFGWYAMLVYFFPLLGGWLADHKWGHVKTVIVGASIITLGHASMAVADLPVEMDLKFMFYLGLLFIVLGTGLFKPNMSSIVGKMYPTNSPKKDGAYTIFYMGVNSGAFIGTLLVGWIGENYSWTWGFGLAGIFMFFGLLQFAFAKDVFGEAANKPQPKKVDLSPEDYKKIVPFTDVDYILAIIGAVLAFSWIIDGVFEVVTRGGHILPQNVVSLDLGNTHFDWGLGFVLFLISIVIFVFLGLSRIKRFEKIERDRLKVVFIIAFFVVFFWASFEQAATSLNYFAKDYTNRELLGNWGLIYKIFDLTISLIPMFILTWIIIKLSKSISKQYPLTILFITISFIIIWYLVILRVYDKVSGDSTIVDTSWFQILNPFFIVILAPLYSKFWKKYKFSGPQKFAIGLTLLGLGFGAVSFGASGIPKGAATASVSLVWLLLAYLLHTMGELSVSPVGLSYVSKLTPARMLAFLFGIWYVFTGLAGKLAAAMGGSMDAISKEVGLSGFFLIFTVIPIIAALVILSLNGKIKRMMHGIE